MNWHSWYSSCLSTAKARSSQHVDPTPRGATPSACSTHHPGERSEAHTEQSCGHSVCSAAARMRRSSCTNGRGERVEERRGESGEKLSDVSSAPWGCSSYACRNVKCSSKTRYDSCLMSARAHPAQHRRRAATRAACRGPEPAAEVRPRPVQGSLDLLLHAMCHAGSNSSADMTPACHSLVNPLLRMVDRAPPLLLKST